MKLKHKSLTNAELCDLYDRMQEALAERERLQAEEEQLRQQEARRAQHAREADRLERELRDLTKRRDRLAKVDADLEGRIAEAEESGPWHLHEGLVETRRALVGGLQRVEGMVVHEKGGESYRSVVVVPDLLRELLPGEDYARSGGVCVGLTAT